MKGKKKVVSLIGSIAMLGVMSLSSITNVQASEESLVKIDESYLTEDESSTGYTPNYFARGIHLMDGECSITKKASNKIYASACTTANHRVDTIGVIAYVDRYNSKTGKWGQIDYWTVKDEDDYFVIASKTLTVTSGYYYRVHADHYVQKEPDKMEMTFSYTNGIKIS